MNRMSDSPTPSEGTDVLSGRGSREYSPTLYLEVSRGITEYPQRPVTEGRILIGAGPQCGLRLGGDQIPLLHSILHVEGTDIWLDAVADSPSLKVNGEVLENALIDEGDRVEIGSFQFVVRRAIHDPGSTTEDKAFSNGESSEADIDMDVLSASDLVDLIEAEQQMVDDFGGRRRMGADALLQAALKRLDDDSAHGDSTLDGENPEYLPFNVQDTPAPFLQDGEQPADLVRSIGSPEDISDATNQLNAFATQLEQRSAQIAQREAAYAQAANDLLGAQERFSEQVEAMEQRLRSLGAGQDGSLRHTA